MLNLLFSNFSTKNQLFTKQTSDQIVCPKLFSPKKPKTNCSYVITTDKPHTFRALYYTLTTVACLGFGIVYDHENLTFFINERILLTFKISIFKRTVCGEVTISTPGTCPKEYFQLKISNQIAITNYAELSDQKQSEFRVTVSFLVTASFLITVHNKSPQMFVKDSFNVSGLKRILNFLFLPSPITCTEKKLRNIML